MSEAWGSLYRIEVNCTSLYPSSRALCKAAGASGQPTPVCSDLQQPSQAVTIMLEKGGCAGGRPSHVTSDCDLCTCWVCGRSVPLDCIWSKTLTATNIPESAEPLNMSALRSLTDHLVRSRPTLTQVRTGNTAAGTGFPPGGAVARAIRPYDAGIRLKYRGSSCLHHMAWTS